MIQENIMRTLAGCWLAAGLLLAWTPVLASNIDVTKSVCLRHKEFS